MSAVTRRASVCRRKQPSLRWAANRRTHGERRAVDPEAEPLIPAFVENRRADVVSVPSLVQAGAFSQIGLLGHNMKGTSVSFGFPRMGDIGADLVVAASRADGAWVLRLNDELRGLLALLPGTTEP